jgi:aspartate-semialdehyde dehydrogenase
MKNIAIVGATGAVGREIIGCLERRTTLPIKDLRLLASSRSKGVNIPFRGECLSVEELTQDSFE